MLKLKLPRGRTLDLSTPQIMGIVNVTPDSFSDGGKYCQSDSAVNHGLTLLQQGASVLDIGGESTRPGAPDVALEQELERVIPVIEGIRAQSDCVISVDTSKAEVMSAAIEAGADMINDVRALQEPGALDVAAHYDDVAVCLMHMQGQPRTMQLNPCYEDLFRDISAFFESRMACCVEAGIARERLIIDPGFGFGKTLEHNFSLLGQLSYFAELQRPILAGLSRKSMFGKLLNRDTDERLAASLSGALLCAQQGAQIIRVHDVKETNDVLRVWRAATHGVNE
ncbi:MULTISPECIES: dihydropteroate synthase [Pseudoalteromonas]|uniref:dihydropteroate synthase n=1 Tax=Pseudoalteromonas TaxID=53246 RepID=UPI001891ACCF|nr:MULTISPECIES: dihydropteroate synthase [Pseudoalteromonas]MCG7563367.1 dihydropteroate synthase [Pseudoalteromonas sp. McH1-42]MEC4089669.1 dihydropteroate synthase [Pseudoalteromonas rubra]